MKNLLFTLLIICFSLSSFSQEKGYKIKMEIKGMSDSTCHLISYFGNQRYYKDTAVFDKKGIVIFSGKKQIESGIYGVYTGGKVLFEIIVDEPIIELTTDTSDYIKNMVVKKSKENQIFLEHLRYVGERQKKSQKLREKYKDENIKSNEKEEIETEIKQLEEEIKKYQLAVIEKHPKSFVASIFHAMLDPEVPEFKEEKNDSINKIMRYQHYKKHFFDHINFADGRIIRTPIYHNKISKYFESVVYPHADSIIKESDILINNAKANDDLFKYTVHHLINKYERSKIMGLDAVFAHIAENYYTHDLAFWVDSNQIEKVQEKVRKLKPLLIGKQAINLSLLDTSGNKWESLHKIESDYTILIFWKPDCGHCKKELPKIAEYYHTIKNKNVSVYAVSSDHDNSWKKFIREKNLNFVNVAVPKDVYEDNSKATEYIVKGFTDLESLNYHTTYDVYSTPQIYLLDKDKNIIGKKLDSKLLKKILDKKLEDNQK